MVVRERRRLSDTGEVPVQLAIYTSKIAHAEGGLVLEPTEIVEISVPPTRYRPPSVRVTHPRFVGFPHVLQGFVLCVYLDASREWNPNDGAIGFLNRLWGWFESAAAGTFDPHTSLFHAVGGTDSATDSTPIVVLRNELDDGLTFVALIRRNGHRFDVAIGTTVDGLRTPIITAPAALPLGTGTSIFELATILDDPTMSRGGLPAVGLPTNQDSIWLRLAAAAKRNPDASPQPFVLCVPHPAGGPPHVIVGCLPSETADALRLGSDPQDPRIEWWRVSDERPSVTTRRDSTRPTAAFADRTVLLFGCGGLGSWIAEFVARAGARRVVLSDSAIIMGGLLVRQNYTEADIGASKESALVSRLHSVRDDLQVEILDDSESLTLTDFDLVIDASVSMALGQVLSSVCQDVLVAQVAVDPRSAAVGMILVKPAGCAQQMSELDAHFGKIVEGDSSLEEYHSLWSTSTHGMLVPTRGCSVPTFHGSAADLAASAGVMVSLLGLQLQSPKVGVHLYTLPHTSSHRTKPAVFLPLDSP
nr:ThiF family adenylyltransferase [Plantibacter sp. PA-3-X8]